VAGVVGGEPPLAQQRHRRADAEPARVLGGGGDGVDDVLGVGEDDAECLEAFGDGVGGQVHPGDEHAHPVWVHGALHHHRAAGQQAHPHQGVDVRVGGQREPLRLGGGGGAALKRQDPAGRLLADRPRPAGERQQLTEALHAGAADDDAARAAAGRDHPVRAQGGERLPDRPARHRIAFGELALGRQLGVHRVGTGSDRRLDVVGHLPVQGVPCHRN